MVKLEHVLSHGCTDATAVNYNSLATVDDGSCMYPCLDNSVYVAVVTDYYGDECSWDITDASGAVVASGGPYGIGYNTVSDSACVIDGCYTLNMYDSYGDGWNTSSMGSVTLTDGIGGTYAYGTLLTGSSASFAFTVGTVDGCTDATATNYDACANNDDGSCITLVNGCTNVLACNFDSTATVDDGSCLTAYGCMDVTAFNYDSLATCSDSSTCVAFLYGCTDSLATNYDPLANTDDSSCITLVNGCTNVLACNFDSTATFDDGSCLTAYGCMDVSAFNYDPLATCSDSSTCVAFLYGCTDTLAVNYYAAANSDDGSCLYPGCTDSTATNYNASANLDDGSCIPVAPGTCGAITGVNLTDVIHDRLVFNWDDMNSATCVVDQIRIRYREVGTSSYTNKTMGAPVGNNAPCLNTSKLALNLIASTQYEYDFKIWYQDGTNVNWHANGTFTTADVCVNATNMIATPNNPTQAEFCWDAPASTWSFVRLQYRENVPGSSFSNIGGFGVLSPDLCKTKNGLTADTEYRVMWRTWCSATGGPYRSPVWEGPVVWSQPTTIRVEGGSAIN